jgi:Cdc6-like AAA superfamily ATPase
MLSIYKSKNSTRVCAIKSNNVFLHGLPVYIVRKIRNKIEQEDINSVLATYVFFDTKNQNATDYNMAFTKAEKLKPDLKDVKDLNQIELDDDSSFVLLPHDPTIDRDSIYIAGTAGCGKTFMINNYLERLIKSNTGKDVYYISVHNLKFDPSISDYVKQHIGYINPSKLTSFIKATEKYKDAIFVFDDVDSSINEEETDEEEESDNSDEEEVVKKVDIKKDLQKMTAFAKKSKLSEGIVRNSAINLVSNGRKYGISIVFISHKLKEIATNKISHGCNTLVVFPEADGAQITPFLTSRTNLDKKTVENILEDTDKYQYEPLVINKALKYYTYQNKMGTL